MTNNRNFRFFFLFVILFLILLYFFAQREYSQTTQFKNIPYLNNDSNPQTESNSQSFVRKFQHFSYDPDWTQGRHECLMYENPNITSFSDISDTYWNFEKTQHNTNHDVQPIFYGTLYAQNLLWQIQHPPDCTKAKFSIIHHHGFGIGSSLHVAGVGLALSVEMNRTVIFDSMPEGHWAYGNFCTSDHSWTCFFHPPSDCYPTPEQLLTRRDWNGDYNDTNPVVFITSKHTHDNKLKIPKQLDHLVSCSPIPENYRYWWWRVQSTTYLVRPTNRTLDEIERLKKIFYLPSNPKDGTISVHVRHSDKYTEMNLVSFDKYMIGAQKLVDENKFLKKQIYLGTEDNKVIDEATQIIFNGQWQINWILEERTNDGVPTMLKDGYKRVLLDLLGLQLHLQCDAHIGTLQSNWVRVIVELASTIGYCAGCPYVEVNDCQILDCLTWK